MKKICPIVCFYLACVVAFISCAAGPSVIQYNASTVEDQPPHSGHMGRHDLPSGTVITTLASAVMPEDIAMAAPVSDHLQTAVVPERVPRPVVPQYIMGSGIVSAEDLLAFLLDANPEADMEFVENLVKYYIEEAAIEGVNHDIAFSQMCLETGFLRFGNLVTPDQNNFCGLGATGPGQPGLRFPDPRTGVRAHIQHLKAYATDAPLNRELVNPRYFLVRLGSSPAIWGLAGTWATDPLYADKINNILERLYFSSSLK